MKSFTKYVVSAAVALVLVLGAKSVANASYMQSGTLQVGSTGSQVLSLQQTLNMTSCKVASSGASSPGMETTTFGPRTKAAVQCFQSANGLTADGVVGNLTGAKLALVSGATVSTGLPAGCSSTSGFSPITGSSCNAPVSTGLPAGCSSTSGYSTTSGSPCSGTPATTVFPAGCSSDVGFSPTTGQSCSGGTTVYTGTGSGVLTNVNTVSGYSGLTLNAGEQNDKVLGAQFTASGGDMKIDRLTVDFQRTSSSGYYQLSQYISSVSVMNASGAVLATVPVTAASDITTTSPDTFEFDIAGLNYTVPNGTTGSLYVAVNVNPTIDSSNASGNSWTVSVPANGLRAIDSSGFTDYYPSGASTLASNTFTVDNLSSSGNVQLRASIDPSSPLAYGQQVNATTGNTANVKLLAVTMYAKPGSAITVRKFPVTLTETTSVTGNVAQMVNNITLSNGTASYTANIPAACSATTTTHTCTVVFGSDSGVLNWIIPAGATQTWTVTASIAPTSANFAEGDSLVASVDSASSWIGEGFDAEDSVGNPLSGSDLTGGATGNPVGFFVNGVTVTSAGTSASVNQSLNSATHETGTFIINFTVNALNSSIYIPKTATSATPATNGGHVYFSLTDLTSASLVSGATGSVTSTTSVSGDTSTDFYVSAGSSRTFTLTVGYTATSGTSGHQFSAGLVDTNYSLTSGSGYKDYTLNLNNIYTNPPLTLS